MKMLAVLWTLAALCTIGSAQVSDGELLEVSARLWDDPNNMADGVDYSEDGGRLFISVDEGRLSQGTYGRLQTLRGFYTPLIGVPDNCGTGTSCYSAQDSLLDLVMTSQPMTIVHEFLASKGLADPSLSGFRSEIRQYFFQEFSRSGGAALDSSAFEHTFLGEVRNVNEITGFHGWVQAYLLERDGAFTLDSYQATCQPDVSRVSFSWTYQGSVYTKPVSSISMGSSVEAEMALYALCFQSRPTSACVVELDGNRRTVTTYEMSGVSPRTIGTAYISC